MKRNKTCTLETHTNQLIFFLNRTNKFAMMITYKYFSKIITIKRYINFKSILFTNSVLTKITYVTGFANPLRLK